MRLLNNHKLRMEYAELLSLANATILASNGGVLEPDDAETYGLVGFVSDSNTQVYVPFCDETLRDEVNPVEYYGEAFLKSKFYNPEQLDIDAVMPTMRILYAREDVDTLREEFVNPEVTHTIMTLGVQTDMGVSEIVDTLFAMFNNERAVGYLLSTDGDKEAAAYLETMYLLIDQGYGFEDNDKVMQNECDYKQLLDNMRISLSVWMSRPEEKEDCLLGLPELRVRVFGRDFNLPMNADLYSVIEQYVKDESEGGR